MNDDQLIDAALAGNAAAFGDLVVRYQDRLYNALVYVAGCTEDARDAAQDAFVQAFVKLESFQRQSAFYTWLYRIAINIFLTKRRRRRPSHSVDEIRLTTGEEPPAAGDSPHDRIEQQETVDQVQFALSQLDDDYRQILILREMDGCDYETIANMLELPIGTVRSRLHRARLELREQLKLVLQEDHGP